MTDLSELSGEELLNQFAGRRTFSTSEALERAFNAEQELYRRLSPPPVGEDLVEGIMRINCPNLFQDEWRALHPDFIADAENDQRFKARAILALVGGGRENIGVEPSSSNSCERCGRGEISGMDDGSWVELGASAGGAHERRMWGWLQLIHHEPDGSTVYRDYIATDTAAPSELAQDGAETIPSKPDDQQEGERERLSDFVFDLLLPAIKARPYQTLKSFSEVFAPEIAALSNEGQSHE